MNRAIQSSNLNLVKRLLETHSSPNQKIIQRNKNYNNFFLDPRNQDPVTKKTSLILATEFYNFDICKLLIQDYHVDSEFISRDLENNTVLHIAATEGLDDIITLYHSHYPFVLDWANSEGMTALHIASQKGQESTVALLLDFEADVELTDNEGNTSLHYAAAWGHLKIVLLLIDRGSPFWAKNNQTFTASDYAFSFSIQSALQESARAHFESKKQQRHQRQQRDRDKERKQHQRSVVGSTSIGMSSESSINLIRPAPLPPSTTTTSAMTRGVTKSPQQTQASTTSRPNAPPVMPVNPMIHKVSTSPTTTLTHSSSNSINTINSHSTPLVPITVSSSSTSKPLVSPTNSIATARTVSYLISKDLEAIQDFRTKTAPSHSSTNSQPLSSTAATETSQSSSNTNNTRLLPLQLVNAVGSKPTASTVTHELRSCSSTGNLNKPIQPSSIKTNLELTTGSSSSGGGGSRNRAGSTESHDISSPVVQPGLGYRECLSRLKYLKNSPNVFLLSPNS